MKRCAIYTRKSTEEGLEQDFNSLDAQHEACAAYIKSQKHEGWKALRARFDDGGFSGGSMDRPALAKLLEAVERREVDVVVVYKVDRLTRSLPDFAKIVELFDANGVSFVSVTQQFNTTSSMGRLTLNVLLSFAQFEREVTAERIRDKIAASKRKGLWMGGPVPLGYRVEDRKLIVDPDGAKTVRKIFDLYLSLGTVQHVQQEADRQNLRTRRKVSKTGRTTGGVPFARGHLYKILSNPIYVGDMPHKGEVHPGAQDAIIQRETWNKVQGKLAEQSVVRKSAKNTASPSLLKGLLFDDTGAPMHVIQAAKGKRRYRYYVSSRVKKDAKAHPDAWRLPAGLIEGIVVQELARFLADRIVLQDVLGLEALQTPQVEERLRELQGRLTNSAFAERCEIVQSLVVRLDLSQGHLILTLRIDRLAKQLALGAGDLEEHVVSVPIAIQRRGVERKTVLIGAGAMACEPDPSLCNLIAKAQGWMEALSGAAPMDLQQLAAEEGMATGEVSRLLPLAFLAPDIVEAILDGRQPTDLTARRLRRLRPIPEDWADQRRLLGFPTIA